MLPVATSGSSVEATIPVPQNSGDPSAAPTVPSVDQSSMPMATTGSHSGTVITSDPDEPELSSHSKLEPSMQDIAQVLAQAAEAETTAENIPRAHTSYGEPFRLSIDATFNFEHTYWIETMERLGLRGLEEELEVQGLFDSDTDGGGGCEEPGECN